MLIWEVLLWGIAPDKNQLGGVSMTQQLRDIAKVVKKDLANKKGDFLTLANTELDKIESCKTQRGMLINLIAFLLPIV